MPGTEAQEIHQEHASYMNWVSKRECVWGRIGTEGTLHPQRCQ